MVPFQSASSNTHPAKAPAVSIARNMRAVGSASGALVGTRKSIRDQNATRDVTDLLAKSGMAMQVERDHVAPRKRLISFHPDHGLLFGTISVVGLIATVGVSVFHSQIVFKFYVFMFCLRLT